MSGCQPGLTARTDEKNRAIFARQSRRNRAFSTLHLELGPAHGAALAPRAPYERREPELIRARRHHSGPFVSRTI
ncbi:unnamed protein product [Leptosia nina]|uniref:Uncharacterized protein n=1 Tax=Leptosia nina TaxID=320188 RepID=A0AAV1JHI8_9NEOP